MTGFFASSIGDGMQKTSQNNEKWRRYKEISVPWATYDTHRPGECGRILYLQGLFSELDKPVQTERV